MRQKNVPPFLPLLLHPAQATMRACYSKSLFIFLYFAGFTLSSVVDEIVEIVKYCHDRLIVAAPALDRISDFLN